MAQFAVRLPDRVLAELDRAALDQDLTRSEVVRMALEDYLYRLACDRDADVYGRTPLSDTELALADDPEGWATTAPW